MPHNAIRYILGATGAGRQELRLNPGLRLSYIDYVFIRNDEDVRTWLLSNPVLEDPLDLLVYCHRPATAERAATPPLRRQNYLRENAVANWARAAAESNDVQAPGQDSRAYPRPPNAGREQEQGVDPPLFLPVSSGSPSDVSDAGAGREAGVGISPSPDADRVVQSGSEKLDERMSNRLRQVYDVIAMAGRKRGALCDDEKGNEAEVKRLRWSLSGEFDGIEGASIVP